MDRNSNDADPRAELQQKMERLQNLMREQDLDAVVISRHENIAWLTAGKVDIRVGMLRETGPASLLITRDGDSFYITTTNEAARLAEEEFAELAYKPLLRPWTSGDVDASIRSVVPKGNMGTDIALGGYTLTNLQPLRLLLTAGECDRYRWLGQQMAATATKVLMAIEPGMSERTVQAMLAQELISRGLIPSVYLGAVDHRVRMYPHPVPRAAVLKRYAMLCFCARYGGLAASMTRFVHFGPLPADLADNFCIVAHVNARIQSATRVGASSAELFTVLQDAYKEAGAPGGEQSHHQGGAAGYLEREWLALPGGVERLTSAQAFAWNPCYHGAKVEDTRLLLSATCATLTRTPDLPEVLTSLDAAEYVSAGVLIR
jgi:Xaa-Pro dipeptidase